MCAVLFLQTLLQNKFRAWPTVRVAAERGLSLWCCQVEVEVSRQVFDPHWRVFWEQGLTASQLLLQVPNIKLKGTRPTKYYGCILRNNTSIMHRCDWIWACDGVPWRSYNAVLCLCVCITFMAFKGFTKPIIFSFFYISFLTMIRQILSALVGMINY